MTPVRDAPTPGLVIDKYRLISKLGRGVSADVWKAEVAEPHEDVGLEEGQIVAMKLYLRVSGDEVLRVSREFTTAVYFDHPNLVRVYDLMLAPARRHHEFLVMEFVEGKTLKDYIPPNGLDDKLTLGIGLQLFTGLTEVHRHGVLHRDIKCANIMVSEAADGSLGVKLLDFGIVTRAGEGGLTGTEFLGSKHYSSMEQLTAGDLDDRSDIYSAGAALYHCLEGHEMYAGVGPPAAIALRMNGDPAVLSEADTGESPIRKGLVQLVNECIQVRPANRPSSAEECLQRLLQLSTDLMLSHEEASELSSADEGALLRDDFATFSGWQPYSGGAVRPEVDPRDPDRWCLLKFKNNDPSGGFKLLQKPTQREVCLSGRLLSQSDRSGGAGNRLSIANANFNGYGFLINQTSQTLALEHRREGRAAPLSKTVEAPVPMDEWYAFRLEVSASEVSVILSDRTGATIAKVSAEDSEHTDFDRVVVHGGYEYFVSDLLVERLG